MYKNSISDVHKNTLLNIVTFMYKTYTDNLPEVLNLRTKNVQIRL